MATGQASLSRTQHRRKLLLWLIAVPVAALLLVDTPFMGWHTYHELVEFVGLALIVLCFAGRTWSALYIGGRKGSQLVDHGPYSVMRNPLYLFSIAGAVGIGLSAGSLVLGAAIGALAFVVFNGLITKEEAFLADRLGAPYQRYLQQVPRWWPQFARWHDSAEVAASPRLVMHTLRDASLFFLAIPLLETVEMLHEAGDLPGLLALP